MKKVNYFLSTITILISFTDISIKANESEKNNKEIAQIQTLWPLCPTDAGLCGYIDKKGSWKINPQFDLANHFRDGMAFVKKDGFAGYIDKNGQWLVKPEFAGLNVFSEDVAGARKSNKWGYIDKNGNWIIKPKFDGVSVFYKGAAPAELAGKWGLINLEGDWILKPEFNYIGHFNNGLAKVTRNGKSGFINSQGEWKIQPDYAFAFSFKEGLASVLESYSSKGRRYINTEGEWATEPIFERTLSFSDGLAFASPSKNAQPNSALTTALKKSLQTGKKVTISGKEYTSAAGNYGYIDKTGEWIIPPIYVVANNFYKGVAVVGNGVDVGLINKKGEYLIEPNWEAIIPVHHETGILAIGKLDNKWQIILDDTKLGAELPYEKVSVRGKLIQVSVGDRNGYLDFDGNVIAPLPDKSWFSWLFSPTEKDINWSCKAFGKNDATGYSYDLSSIEKAKQKALQLCNAKKDNRCRIVSCAG